MTSHSLALDKQTYRYSNLAPRPKSHVSGVICRSRDFPFPGSGGHLEIPINKTHVSSDNSSYSNNIRPFSLVFSTFKCVLLTKEMVCMKKTACQSAVSLLWATTFGGGCCLSYEYWFVVYLKYFCGLPNSKTDSKLCPFLESGGLPEILG